MDYKKLTTESYRITSHGTTMLEVVYNNMPETVEQIIAMYEKWLKKKYKFVGLDIEYTRWVSYKPQRVAVVQLAMRDHVLVYHFYRSERCQALDHFLQRKGITFASVDTRGDKTVLGNDWILIPDEHHVNIQREFRIKGGGKRDSMSDLAKAIIDPSYNTMKTSFPKEKHDYWEWKPLSLSHLVYAAKDGFVCYGFYRRILIIKHGLRHLLEPSQVCERLRPRENIDEGTSSGWKRQKGNIYQW